MIDKETIQALTTEFQQQIFKSTQILLSQEKKELKALLRELTNAL